MSTKFTIKAGVIGRDDKLPQWNKVYESIDGMDLVRGIAKYIGNAADAKQKGDQRMVIQIAEDITEELHHG